MRVSPDSALIVVDVQNDFCPGGALPVPSGDEVIPILNRLMGVFRRAGAPIVATRDWHTADHCSFKDFGGIWPPHCVQGTPGADFRPGLKLTGEDRVVSKGSDREREAYSGFQQTDLAHWLKEKGVRNVFVGGLATDYCVKSTVLDGLKEGFQVYFLPEAARAVNVRPGDDVRAQEEMSRAGAKNISVSDLAGGKQKDQ